jgi:hypothetical protein
MPWGSDERLPADAPRTRPCAARLGARSRGGGGGARAAAPYVRVCMPGHGPPGHLTCHRVHPLPLGRRREAQPAGGRVEIGAVLLGRLRQPQAVARAAAAAAAAARADVAGAARVAQRDRERRQRRRAAAMALGDCRNHDADKRSHQDECRGN